METKQQTVPQAIQWPTIRVGGRDWTLRLSYAAHYKLGQWGKTIADATIFEVAAACAGEFDPLTGKWSSADFRRPIDFADLVLPEEAAGLENIADVVTDVIKKAAPGVEVSAAQPPAQVETQNQNS